MMLDHCTLGRSQRAISPGIWKTAYTVRRQQSYTRYTAHRFVICEELWVFAVNPWHLRGRRALGLRHHHSFAAAGDVVAVGGWYVVVVLRRVGFFSHRVTCLVCCLCLFSHS